MPTQQQSIDGFDIDKVTSDRLHVSSWKDGLLRIHCPSFARINRTHGGLDLFDAYNQCCQDNSLRSNALVSSKSVTSGTIDAEAVERLKRDYYIISRGSHLYTLHKHTEHTRKIRAFAPGMQAIHRIETNLGYLCLADRSMVKFIEFRGRQPIAIIKAGLETYPNVELQKPSHSERHAIKRSNAERMQANTKKVVEQYLVQGKRLPEPGTHIVYYLVPKNSIDTAI